MGVVVITPPAVPLVSLVDAKKHLRVDGDDEDTLIEGLVEAATSWIDAPQGWLGRALLSRTLEFRTGTFAPWVDLPFPPAVEIVSVKYDDRDGAEQSVDPAVYRLVGSATGGARVVLTHGSSWPAYRWQDEAVRVQYVAGYGPDPADVPAAIRHAILLLIGHLYENREAEVVGDRAAVIQLPTGVDALLSPFRVF